VQGVAARSSARPLVPAISACLSPEINANGALVGLGTCLRRDYVLTLRLAPALPAVYLRDNAAGARRLTRWLFARSRIGRLCG
jgi:hypothetical protein